MLLKPKNTTFNARALLYRRFTDVETATSLYMIYKTNADNKYWTFNKDNNVFTEIDISEISGYQTRNIYNTTMVKYKNNYFKYAQVQEVYKWVDATIDTSFTILSASFNNIGKYQTNKYYLCGSFDYVYKGSIDNTEVQPLRGAIMKLSSFTIKYFNDNLKVSQDDLIVINNALYSVERPEITVKRLPKPFNIYTATLNSII